MNPFVALLKARGYLLAGDAWARLALQCADRARDCWALAGQWMTDAEGGLRDLGHSIETERARGRASDVDWNSVLDRLEQERGP